MCIKVIWYQKLGHMSNLAAHLQLYQVAKAFALKWAI